MLTILSKNKDIRKRAVANALSSRYKVKEAQYKDKVFRYMGYELPAIKALVKKYGYRNVQTDESVEPLDLGQRLYFPDIYVKSVDLYVEVKSLWTLFGSEQAYYSNRRKAKAAVDCGYKLRWVLCSDTDVLTLLPKDWYKNLLGE